MILNIFLFCRVTKSQYTFSVPIPFYPSSHMNEGTLLWMYINVCRSCVKNFSYTFLYSFMQLTWQKKDIKGKNQAPNSHNKTQVTIHKAKQTQNAGKQKTIMFMCFLPDKQIWSLILVLNYLFFYATACFFLVSHRCEG